MISKRKTLRQGKSNYSEGMRIRGYPTVWVSMDQLGARTSKAVVPMDQVRQGSTLKSSIHRVRGSNQMFKYKIRLC